MSRHHRKNLKRGIKQPLVNSFTKFRNARHGQEQKVRAFVREERTVPAGTEGAKRSIETVNGEVTVVYRVTVEVPVWRSMTPSTQNSVRVAAGPTGTHGAPNKAPKTTRPKAVPA